MTIRIRDKKQKMDKKQVGFKLQIKHNKVSKAQPFSHLFKAEHHQLFIPQPINHIPSMRPHQQYDSQQFQNQSQTQRAQQYFVKQKMRNEAYNRKTQYTHPAVTFFDHQQINSKESEELRKQLVGLYKPKVELMRTKFDLELMEKDYENNYQEFIKMTLKNQIQERQISQAIGEMHEMADILLNPPDLAKTDNLFLYSKNQPTELEQQQIDRIFNLYQIAYKEGVQVEDNQAQQTIKRAKQFLRDRYS